MIANKPDRPTSLRYAEKGGLRWGCSFWGGTNATWPFATLLAKPGQITVTLNCLGVMKETFHFTADNLTGVQTRRGIFPFSTGVVFHHTDPNYPPFILFWSFRFGTLKKELGKLGFAVLET